MQLNNDAEWKFDMPPEGLPADEYPFSHDTFFKHLMAGVVREGKKCTELTKAELYEIWRRHGISQKSPEDDHLAFDKILKYAFRKHGGRVTGDLMLMKSGIKKKEVRYEVKNVDEWLSELHALEQEQDNERKQREEAEGNSSVPLNDTNPLFKRRSRFLFDFAHN